MIRHFLPFAILVLIGCTEPRGKDPGKSNRQAGTATESTEERAKRETREAVDAVGDLAADKRVEWELEMKQELDELDDQMAKLSRRIDAAQGEAKEKLQKEWKDLEPQRERAQQRLNELKDASGEAWIEIRKSARAAFDELRDGVNRASSRFQAEEAGAENK